VILPKREDQKKRTKRQTKHYVQKTKGWAKRTKQSTMYTEN